MGKEEIRKIRKYPDMNENKTIIYQTYGMKLNQCLEGNLSLQKTVFQK